MTRTGITVLSVAVAALICALALTAMRPALAQDSGAAANSLVPHPPKARKGEHCVADTNFMRRYHMMMLKHQRRETVHAGERSQPFSLGKCIECHAVKDKKGQFVTYSDAKHFCRSCHDYAAVSIDCFECHASRPEAKGKAAGDLAGKKDVAALSRYLKEREAQQ